MRGKGQNWNKTKAVPVASKLGFSNYWNSKVCLTKILFTLIPKNVEKAGIFSDDINQLLKPLKFVASATS